MYDPAGMPLSDQDRRRLLHLARHAIRGNLGLPVDPADPAPAEAVATPGGSAAAAGDGDPAPEPASPAPEGSISILDERRRAFVSLHVRGELRGCVGTMTSGERLAELIPELAVTAATRDGRFPPLTPDEVADVSIEISVLTPPQALDDPGRLKVGRHGLMISRGPLRGVLLPQVATEQGWDREAFLSATCRKAGLEPGAWRAWADGRDPDLVVEMFSAEVFGED